MRSCAAPLLLSLILVAPRAALAQTPQPFPKAPAAPPSTGSGTGSGSSSAGGVTTQPPRGTTPPPPAPTAPTAAAGTPGAEAPPTAATLGLPLPPGAQFLASYDAGQGQRYFLYGSASTYAEVLNFYRGALKQRGDVVFEEPATQIFEVGRFREDTMAFPPGVVVKDYTWGNIGGYMNPKPGAQPARFPTVIQIVPVPAADRDR
jgi:hypothetical protein